MKRITQAVILAGGLGTRMRPLTDAMPKSMIPIHGKPFLWYLIEGLKKNQITEIVLLVGYKHELIKKYFGNGKRFDISIRYSYAPIEADTGTRIRQALPFFKNRFLLLYGDNYWPLSLPQLATAFFAKKTLGIVTVYANEDRATKNNMLVAKTGRVRMYDRTRTKKHLNGVDIGFFIFSRKAFVSLPKENFSFEDVVMPRLIAAHQLAAYQTRHKYYGLSTLDRIPLIEEYFRPKKVVFLDRDGVINKKKPPGEYVTTWKEFVFLPRALAGLKLLAKKGYEIYIVTNQAGIARKKLSKKQLDAIHGRMVKSLSDHGVSVRDIFVCPHGWDEGCACRKPRAGLFFQAGQKYHVNLFDCYCIGDDERDIQAGTEAGCKTLLVGSPPYLDLYDAAQHI